MWVCTYLLHFYKCTVECSKQQQADCRKLLQRMKLQSCQHPGMDRSTSMNPSSSHRVSSTSAHFSLPAAWPLQHDTVADTGREEAGKLAMQITQQEGRQLVAAQTLPAGLPVWTEQPYAHALYRQHIRQVVTMSYHHVFVHCMW